MKTLLSLVTTLLLAGCSTYTDQKLAVMPARAPFFNTPLVDYCPHASYATDEGTNEGETSLATLLGISTAQEPARIRISTQDKDSFSIALLDRHLTPQTTRHYVRGIDFQETDEGIIEIKRSSRCNSGDTPGLGCAWQSLQLFNDENGNLTVVQDRGGAGLIGIVPVAMRSQYLSLFPRIAPVPTSRQTALAQCPERRAAIKKANAERQKVPPTFSVGDLVIQHQHYDPDTNTFRPGARENFKGSTWRVLDITHQHIVIELIAGEYKAVYPEGVVRQPGFVASFSSSRRYKAAHPHGGNLGQLYQEFRKVTDADSLQRQGRTAE